MVRNSWNNLYKFINKMTGFSRSTPVFFCVFTLLCAQHVFCFAADSEIDCSADKGRSKHTSVEGFDEAATVPVANNSKWWLMRHQLILENLKTSSPALFFIGDSITQNWEKNAPLPWGNFEAVWNRYYGARNAINLGFGGDTTANVLWRIENGELGSASPKAIVLLIGANNSELKGWHADQTEAGISKIIEVLHGRLPNTRILLLGLLPSDRSELISKTNLEVNDYLSAKYRKSKFVTYLDVRYALLKNGILDKTLFYEPQKQIPGRALHPNAEGQERIAEAIEPVLGRMLKNKHWRWKLPFFKS